MSTNRRGRPSGPIRSPLDQLIKSRGVTGDAIAKACGVRIQTVQNWQRGTHPGKHIAVLARVLGVTIEEVAVAAGGKGGAHKNGAGGEETKHSD